MNPFREMIVATPWENPRGDVPEIHQTVYQKCLDAIAHVRNTGRSTGMLIHGEAGSGKTHLLSRLRARLTPQSPTATDREESLYIWVRLQTSPRMIWRTLRRTLVDDWFRPIDGVRSQFDRVLFHRLSEIRIAEGDLEPWYEFMLQECPDDLLLLLNQIAEKLDLDRNTAVAFEHIAFSRHRRDLRAWLRGDSLPEAALERLELSQDEGTDEEREDHARQVVLMLCRLAGAKLPIVISLDQVEALQSASGDTEGMYAFGQFVRTLHDLTKNVLIVSCVQSAFATELKDQARGANYAAITEFGDLSLDPLNRLQAKDLIQSRIAGVPVTNGNVIGESETWPLTLSEFDELFSSGFPVTPRSLLAFCADRFDMRAANTVGHESGPDGVVTPESGTTKDELFLEDRWQDGIEDKLKSNEPEKTEEIVRHGFPMVMRLVAPEHNLVNDEQLPDVSLVYEKASKRTGISICTQSNMNSLAARLKRLNDQFALSRVQRLVLVRDPRVPITPGSKKAKETLECLEKAGAFVVYPATEVLAALDALRDLLSDAKSGDLAYAGRTFSTRTVEDWLRSNLTEGIRSFADEILGSDEPSGQHERTEVVEALHSLLAEKPILTLVDAAAALQRPIDGLEQFVRQRPEQFGIIEGPPLTLIRAVNR